MNGGHGPSNLDELEPHYSVRLYQTLAKCLMTNIGDRCSLNELKQDVDTAIQQVDRQYGKQLKRGYDEMDDDLKVQTTKQQEGPPPFRFGTRFSRPRKRRKVNTDGLSDALSGSFNKLASDWNSTGTYPSLGNDELGELMSDFNAIVEADTIFTGGSVDSVTFRYLVSILRKYGSKSTPVYFYTDPNWEDGRMRASTVELRRSILQHVRTVIIPNLQAEETVTNNAVCTFAHALDWGLSLNEASGEPRETQLVQPSVLHQAVQHFVFNTPSGDFVDDNAGS